MISRAPLRDLRGLIAGTTCGVGALAAHAWAGGGVPSLWGIATALVASILLARHLARRRLDPAVLMAITLVGQGLLHLGFHTESTSWAPGPMVAGHLVAGVMTAWLASGAESAIWRLIADLIATVLPTLTPVAARTPSFTVSTQPPSGLTGWLLVLCAPRRGPPAYAVAHTTS